MMMMKRGEKKKHKKNNNNNARQQQQEQQQQQSTRKHFSQAVAFGRNYYHAMGGTQERVLQCPENESIQAYCWDEPPWRIRNFNNIHNYNNNENNKCDGKDIEDAVCTTQSTIFLTKHGKVYQTGTLHGRVLTSPTKVEIPLPLKCVQIAAGRHFCLGRMEGGLAVVSWGAGHFGQLGVGPGSVSATTAAVGGSGKSSSNKKKKNNNNSSSNSSGNSSTTTTTSENHLITFTPRPMIIERLLPHVIGSGVVSIAAGDWHGLALTESGRVWAWGSNRSLQCGRKQHRTDRLSASSSGNTATTTQQAPTIAVPLPVPLEVPASKIAAGRSHSVAVARDNGQVYCWGSANRGQCGNNVRRSTGIAPPRLVEGMSDLTICDIAAGGNHTVALTTGGRVFTWGSGSEGELGLGPAVPSQCKPRLVADLDFVAVAAGQEWKSQLQRARLQQQQQPAAAAAAAAQTTKSSLSNVPTICKVFAAPAYSAALSTSGHVYIWGSNDAGQTGIPTPACVPLKDGYNDYSSGSGGHTSSLRDLHVRTFDSRHNILLPTRIDAVADINVRLLACGPNHMWCIGEQRTPQNKDAVVVGQTLYEVQEVQRAKKLQRSREAMFARASAGKGDDCDGDDLTDTSYDRALSSNAETAVEESIATSLASASLSNNNNTNDGDVFQKTDVASSPIHEKQVADIPLSPPNSSSKSPATKEKLTKRFSFRKVFTRMSSGRSLSGKDDTDHQSDMSTSKRSGRSSRRRQDLDEVTA